MNNAIRYFVVALFLACASAINYYCDSSIADQFCNFVLPTKNGVPMYNYPGMQGYNSSQGWVIGQNTIVSLTSSYYQIGTINKFGIQTPAIFIIENGTLEIMNQGSNEVAFAADIYLCGNATYRIVDSKWRLAAQFQYQYLIWASQNSTIFFKGLNFTAIASDVPNTVGGSIGAQWMRGNSKMIVQAGSQGFGITSYRMGDSWELIGIDNSTLTIDQMNVISEFYVASSAKWTITNSRTFDFFFEGCPNVPMAFSSFPALCDITGSGTSPACLSSAVPPINFNSQPPATSFVMNLTNVTMFSWAFSVFQDGNITVNNAAQDTNLYFGINLEPICANDNCTRIITRNFNITASASGITGIQPYYLISTHNTTVTGYHMWMATDNLTLTVNSGSVIGDLAVTAHSVAKVYSSLLERGSVYGLEYASIYFWNSTISESVTVQQNCRLVAEQTTFLQPVTIIGNTSIADTSFIEAYIDIRPGGFAHRVLLSNPALGTDTVLYNNQSLDVRGGVFAVTQGMVSETPFPTAYLLSRNSNGNNVSTTLIQNPTATNDSLLASWNFTGISPGTYTITLSFGANEAVATRSLTLLDWTGASPTPTPSVTPSNTPDTAPSSSPSAEPDNGSASSTSATILFSIGCLLVALF